MRVAICDDDREGCARLRSLIKKQEPDCEVACFDTGKRFLEAKGPLIYCFWISRWRR